MEGLAVLLDMKKLLQAGTVPFRECEGRREFLLITSQKGNWIFPKGIVEPGATPEETALKETREEAGIRGVILPEPVGAYLVRKWRVQCLVQLYLLRYVDESRAWEERRLRRRCWCSYDAALQRIQKPEIRAVLRRAHQRLARKH